MYQYCNNTHHILIINLNYILAFLSYFGVSLQTSLRGVYLASTISEWLVATSVLTFALTFIWDFRALVMETPRVNVNFNMIEV